MKESEGAKSETQSSKDDKSVAAEEVDLEGVRIKLEASELDKAKEAKWVKKLRTNLRALQNMVDKSPDNKLVIRKVSRAATVSG